LIAQRDRCKEKWHVVFVCVNVNNKKRNTHMNTTKIIDRKNLKFYGAVLAALMLCTFQVNAQDESTTETTVQTETETRTYDVDRNNDRDDDYSGPRVGIKGGLNASNLITNEVTDKHGRFGFHAGIYGQLFSSEAFAIQPEVNFSTKGNEVKHNFGIIDQETKFNLSYIDIPVLAVFKLGTAAEIHAGAYWAYLVGANIDTDGDLGDGFVSLDRDNFDNWDYGLVGGIGFNLGQVQLGARYNYGLNEIAQSAGAKRMLGNAKNSVGQIYLAFNLANPHR
jgi:hypothetical protein